MPARIIGGISTSSMGFSLIYSFSPILAKPSASIVKITVRANDTAIPVATFKNETKRSGFFFFATMPITIRATARKIAAKRNTFESSVEAYSVQRSS